MEKYLRLHNNLEKCYTKISFIQYVTLSDEVKENTCKAEREALAEYVNSDAMNHEHILKERINYLKNKQDKAISGNYQL